MTQEFIDRLQAGLKTLNVAVDPSPFMAYAELLYKWNKAYNLTAIRDLPSILAKHIFDSLAISPWLVGKRLIDVGTGAGLPGIPLAIAHPNLEIYLLDSNGKKIQFLLEVKRLLSLTNIAIINSRVESYHPSQSFDMVTSRAFSDIGQMLRWTEHLLSAEGIWLAMKGRYPEAELTTITKPYKVFSYSVPEIEGERCCVVINKNEQQCLEKRIANNEQKQP